MDKPFLPFEIITNILTRLPIKSIIRFQCVSKQWKNLIKTKSFISQHTLHFSHQNPFLLIHAYDDNHHRSTLRLLNHNNMEVPEVVNTTFIDSFTRPWRIVGSSNGLLCVELVADFGSHPIAHLVWNPMSNEVKEIPNMVNINIAAAIVGFGYSGAIDDYKIVRFYHPDFHSMLDNYSGPYSLDCGFVQVYSLSTGSWKELEMGDLRHVGIYLEAANVNGTIFWYGYRVPFEVIIAFDIATEVFTITPVDRFSGVMNLDEFHCCPNRVYEYGNKLALCDAIQFFIYDDLEAYKIYFSVIEAGADESGKRYSCIERSEVRKILPGLPVLCFWRNELVCGFHRRYSRRLVEDTKKNCLHLFNLTSKEWKKIPNYFGPDDQCDILNFEKSLRACLQHLR